ncbi:MAG: hypothetical protein K0R03_2619 [Moraxellaceae bacterium]|nr:hypothetical protein [Moraxellaceae bacterium]
MQGTIAQLLCLVAYGNSFLAGRPLQEFFPQHGTFRHCEFIHFATLEERDGQWLESPYADNPWRWLEALKKAGVVALKAIHVPRHENGLADRLSAGSVGGGGRWLLECVMPAGSDLWEARWEPGARDAAGQCLWQVTYGRVAQGIAMPAQALPGLPELHRDLALALADLRDFADAQGQPEFGACFDRALRALAGASNGATRIAPPDWLAPAAEQLLQACQRAWVFGGTDSWNDVAFDDAPTQQRYAALSDQLFALLNTSLVAATNSHLPADDAPAAPPPRPWWKLW